MIHSYGKQTWIASKGNLPVKADGLPVFLAGSKSPNVMSGEIVVFNPDTNLTVTAASIPNQSKVVVAVGVGADNEVATTLRFLGDGFDLCKDSIDALVTPPVCGTPQVVDIFFDGTQCKSTYGFNILLDDYVVRSNNPQNDRAIYPFVETNPCGSNCTCTTEASCDELMCKFIDSINGKENSDARSIAIFQNGGNSKQYQPFRAARIWNIDDSIQTFDLTPDSGDCSNCTFVPAITGIKIDGVLTAFTGTTAIVGSDTVTLIGQLPRVVDLMNKALEATGGYAHMSRSINGCCSYCIEVTTCAGAILLDSGSDPDISPASTANAFHTAFVNEATCVTCDSADTEVTPTCGIRLYVDPLTVDCLCDLPPNITPPMNYYRKIEVTSVGDWDCADFYTREVSAQTLDEGFGFYYQDREHYQDNGGIGRGYRMGNTHRGEIGLPDAHSRSTNATTIKCKDSYCVYNIEWSHPKVGRFSNSLTRNNKDLVTVLVPSADSTTKTSWETFLAQLHVIGTCISQDVTC